MVFVTFLSLLIGELVPKSIALSNPERFAVVVAPLMQGLAHLTSPLVAMLSLLTEQTLRLLRIQASEQPPITEEEIKSLLVEGTQAGVFEPLEQRIVTQAPDLDDISLRPLLTHRTQVQWIDINAPTEAWYEIVTDHDFSAFPVCDGSMDQPVGIVRARELLLAQHKKVKLTMR